MTAYPPVRFSHGDADNVADELTVTAQLLEQVLGQLASDVVHVQEDWRGGFRDTFELELLRSRLGLQLLASTIRDAAHDVRTGSLEAAAENRYRARRRAEERELAAAERRRN